MLQGVKPKPKDPKEINKWLLDSFFATIKNETQLELEQKEAIPESYTLWSQAYTLSGNIHRNTTINEVEAKELISMSPHMRIVRGMHYQSFYLDSIKHKQTLTELEARLSLLALEQQMYVWDDELTILKQIKKVLKEEECRDRLLKLENRRVTLISPYKAVACKTTTDRVIYERCIRLAFTFDFIRLKEELLNWNPIPEFAINKAVLLSLVDHDACCRMLTTEMLEAIPTRIERYRATQLASQPLKSSHIRARKIL